MTKSSIETALQYIVPAVSWLVLLAGVRSGAAEPEVRVINPAPVVQSEPAPATKSEPASEAKSEPAPAASEPGVRVINPPAPVVENEPAPETKSEPAPPPRSEINLEPPRPEDLFHVESEQAFRARIRTEALARKEQIDFPKSAEPLAAGRIDRASKLLPPQGVAYIPGMVCHGPLYFEDRQTERYARHAPLVQPLLSTGSFYLDTITLPIHMVAHPPCIRECNQGEGADIDVVPARIGVARCR